MPVRRPLSPDYTLDLDRRHPKTLRQQSRQALERAIRAGRPGFRIGERLSTLALARQNPIHRNTLAGAIDDLVYRGYLRRLPNKGFEVIGRRPDRPELLTRHQLSLFAVAHRHHLASRSETIPDACGVFTARQLARSPGGIQARLSLQPSDPVQILCRLRKAKPQGKSAWTVVAIERTAVPARLLPGFLEDALREIEVQGDFSVYRYLQRTFPNDDFFKAHYEISLAPLPTTLAPYWESPAPPMSVVNVTFASPGAIEWTQTWFDSNRAVLVAGSLDVRVR